MERLHDESGKHLAKLKKITLRCPSHSTQVRHAKGTVTLLPTGVS